MNRLQHESSPYLQQHAGNPVDWYAWKSEAFERAEKEDKPILVSIGYSTCHWCHVMERESFENEEIAKLMNENFINIKVDREERPDVDQIYMDACQVFTGQGGWPLNCFLTPDGRPFYAGTYFPPHPAHSRPSWRQLLEYLTRVYREEREKVEKQADQLTARIRRTDEVFLEEDFSLETAAETSFSDEDQHRIFNNMQQHFDKTHGGFGGAPKFPNTMPLEYLLAYAHHYGEQEALHQVGRSLDKMIRGGIYDQLGGGFARYATDRAWLAPHFEKMLYDNGLLVSLLADAYKVTKRPLYRETIEETLGFIRREMTSPEGGFYAALDADSEGEEGKFYVWDKSEIEEVLGPEAELFCEFYGVSSAGNWEGKNILWREKSLAAFAVEKGMEEAGLREQLKRNRELLLEHRSQRVRPGLDDKILLGWNALMASGYAKAYQALREPAYLVAARRNLDLLLERFRQGDGPALFHTYKGGNAQYDAFLDDYAFLIAALLDVYESSFEEQYLREAHRFAGYVRNHFMDEESGLFYYTGAEQTDVLMRKKELYDSAVPSGNSTMVHNLLRLSALFDDADMQREAVTMLGQLKEAIQKYPTTFAGWARATLSLAAPSWEIAVVGARALETAGALNEHFIPNHVMMAATDSDDRYPLLTGRPGGDPPKIYICQQYACQRPVTEVDEALKMVSP